MCVSAGCRDTECEPVIGCKRSLSSVGFVGPSILGLPLRSHSLQVEGWTVVIASNLSIRSMSWSWRPGCSFLPYLVGSPLYWAKNMPIFISGKKVSRKAECTWKQESKHVRVCKLDSNLYLYLTMYLDYTISQHKRQRIKGENDGNRKSAKPILNI